MGFLRFILIILSVCAAISVHADSDIELLYAKIEAVPDAKTANLLIKKLYERGQADSLYTFKRDDDQRINLYADISMSYFYFDKGDFNRAIALGEKALVVAKALKDTASIINIYVQMSSSHIYTSDYKSAINLNKEAIFLAQKANLTRTENVAYAFNNLANCYQNLQQYDVALKYILKAIEVEEALDDAIGLSASYGMASEILQSQQKYDEALNFIYKSIKVAEDNGDELGVAVHHTQAVEVFLMQKRNKEALKASGKALAYFEKNAPRMETIVCYKQYGQLQLTFGNYDVARTYLKKAEKLCLQMNNLHQLVFVYGFLAKAELKSNPDLAEEYYKKQDDIKDSIFSKEIKNTVSEVQVKLDTQEKELVIIKQQRDIKTQQMWQIAIGSAAIVIILLIIVYVSIANSRRNKHHAAQLKVERDEATKARDEATKARDEATKARDEAERANALKGVFIDNVVHELRTPINAIQGFSQLLDPSFGSTPEETQEYLGIINANCNNLITLVQDTIDVSEMESESYPVHPSEFALAGMCKEVIEKERHRVQGQATAGSSDPTSSLGLPSESSPAEGKVNLTIVEKEDIIVNTDRALLSRLLSNLVSNACKYTTSGSITIEYHTGLWSERQGFSLEEMITKARNLEQDSGPIRPWNLADESGEAISTEPIIATFPPQSKSITAGVSITVTDTGCGIAPEYAEKVFNRYEKLGSYVPGNGMGLTIVRLIAHLLKGEAYLDTSYERKGSRFVVELKLCLHKVN